MIPGPYMEQKKIIQNIIITHHLRTNNTESRIAMNIKDQ